MKRFSRSICVAALATLGAAQSAHAQQCPAGPHALVLSGGGARGFAQIGALRVFDSLERRADMVVGTSIGSIVGALYASGLSAVQIDSVFSAVGVASIFLASQPLSLRTFGAAVPLLYWEEGSGGLSLVSGATLNARVNARLNRALLAANLVAAGDFRNLPIPFTAVAADLLTRAVVPLNSGDLAGAVRASMSIPLVFQPHVIGGRQLVDGGIADNLPVGVARRLGAASSTVIDVTSGTPAEADVTSMAATARLLLEHLMLDSRDTAGAADAWLRPDLEGYGNLDFDPVALAEAQLRGATEARRVLPGARCVPAGRRGAQPPGSFRVAGLTIDAPRAADRSFIQEALGLRAGDTVDLARVRRAYEQLERSPEPRELWLNPTRQADGLQFSVVLVPPPRRTAGVVVGYDHDLGGRLGALYLDRTLLDGYAQFATSVTISSWEQRGEFSLRPEPVSWNPVQPALSVLLVHEELRSFAPDGTELPVTDVWESEAQIAAELVAGRWRLRAGPLLHNWNADSGRGNSAGARLHASRGSEVQRPLIRGEGTWTAAWWSAAVATELEHRAGGAGLLFIGRATTTADAPPARRPTLGGSHGFPGHAVFDLRGAHELFLEASAAMRLTAPFVVRAALAGGRSWESHTDEWLGGLRLTLEIPTPAGALRGGYGWATSGRGAVFVRLGAWF